MHVVKCHNYGALVLIGRAWWNVCRMVAECRRVCYCQQFAILLPVCYVERKTENS